MTTYSTLYIPTVLNTPIKIDEINCPICDCEIGLNIIVDKKSSIKCDDCDHKIIVKIKKI
jgi:DNA-directed RNA polymerase subunit RPC12/RpoP